MLARLHLRGIRSNELKEILMVPTNSHPIFLGLIIFNNLMSFFDSPTIYQIQEKEKFWIFQNAVK
jgi:hypothetical protein